MVSDAELVNRTLQGDREAFGEIVQRYQDAVYGLAFHLIGNFADAQDLAQEVFLAAYQRLGQLREPGKLAAWLRRITRRQCASWQRRRHDWLSLDAVPPEEARRHVPTPAEEYERKALREAVQSAIQSLPEKNRLAVTLYYIDGLSQQEIADFLGTSPTVVSSRIHRAKQQLKEQMMSLVEDQFKEHPLPDDFAQRVLAQVVEVGQDAKQQDYVLLRDEALRSLPIWIGAAEAYAIRWQLRNEPPPRPMTHDLMANVLTGLNYRLEEVRIEALRENTFYATLTLSKGRQRKEFDARPSDAINLALRMNAPIYVAEEVMEAATLRDAEGATVPPEQAEERLRQLAAIFVEKGEGRLEVLADGSGLLHLEETGEDVFVPLEIIEQFHLSDGAGLVATARPPEKDESPADFRRVVEVVFRRVERTVEVLEEGHGFLRVSGAGPSPDDVYISAAQVERFGLSSGLTVIATARPPREGERYWSLAGIHNISGPPGEGEA